MKRLQRTGACLFLLFLLFLLLCQAAPVFAAPTLMNDGAGLLSQEERASLESQAQAIYSQYKLPVYVVTVSSMNGQSDAYTYATQLYNQMGLGEGAERSGILLLLSMQYRDYALIAHGDGNAVLTDYGHEQMTDSFLDYFGDDDWAGGFADYLSTADSYCHDYYVEGEAYDYSPTRGIGRICLLLAIVGAPVCGGVTVYALVQQMKTARKQTHAEFYVERSEGQNGLALSDKSDDFIYRQTIVTHRPQPQDHHGGGGFGGTTIGSGGFSGGGGKF